MSHLHTFFCREYRDYALFGVEFLAEICQKFSEILRILAEILRKKSATGVSGDQSRHLEILEGTSRDTLTFSENIYLPADT